MLTILVLLLFLHADPTPVQPSASTLLRQGLGELQNGQIPAAEKHLQEASRLEPANPFIWTALADVYTRTHDVKSAADAASKAEQTEKGNPFVAHALALYYARNGQYAKAGDAEGRFVQSKPADLDAAEARAAAWYLAAGENGKAITLGKQAAAASPNTAFELAQLFLRSQDFTGAADVLQTAVSTYPKDAQLTLALGAARYGQRRFEDAITSFLNVVQLDPDAEQPYIFLAKMLDQARPHLLEIRSAAEAFVARHPASFPVLLALAKIQMADDPACEACEALLHRSLEGQPNNWEAHYQLGLLLGAKHQYAQAVEQLRQASELNPKEPMPHYHLARMLDRTGDSAGAARERELHQALIAPSPPRSN